MMEGPALAPWAEFGLAGLMIGALFFTLILIVKWMIRQTEAMAETHREERREWRDSAREERRDTSDKMAATVGELTRAIQELIR